MKRHYEGWQVGLMFVNGIIFGAVVATFVWSVLT